MPLQPLTTDVFGTPNTSLGYTRPTFPSNHWTARSCQYLVTFPHFTSWPPSPNTPRFYHCSTCTMVTQWEGRGDTKFKFNSKSNWENGNKNEAILKYLHENEINNNEYIEETIPEHEENSTHMIRTDQIQTVFRSPSHWKTPESETNQVLNHPLKSFLSKLRKQ